MKTFRRVLAAAVACGIVGAAGESRALTAQQLRGMLERGEAVVVIDVRPPREFALGHIPGALSIPRELLPLRQLPPLGRVAVCGDGIGTADAGEAVRLLNARPGISAEALAGGMPAWLSLGLADTGGGGVSPEQLRHLSYQELKDLGADPEVTLVDLREGKAAPLTDLAAAFPALERRRAGGAAGKAAERALLAGGRKAERLLVLIDDGDGRAEALARRLKAAGVHRVAVLSGGELSLATQGRSGFRTLESRGTGP